MIFFLIFQIKYGMDSDSDSDDQPKRRTRGRQITYVESDDSEVVKLYNVYYTIQIIKIQ